MIVFENHIARSHCPQFDNLEMPNRLDKRDEQTQPPNVFVRAGLDPGKR